MALDLNIETFNDTVSNKEITMVDFWAPWCGPCKILGPIVEELSDDLSEDGLVNIAKVNVDDNRELSTKFMIRNIPTVLFLNKNGDIIDKEVGVKPKEYYLKKIETLKNNI